jgi:hypothetical protein
MLIDFYKSLLSINTTNGEYGLPQHWPRHPTRVNQQVVLLAQSGLQQAQTTRSGFSQHTAANLATAKRHYW